MPMAMDMGKVMRQARKMQSEMEEAQAEIADTEFSCTAGGGAVEATVNGKPELTSLTIDPAALDDVEMLQDMVMAAVNGAIAEAKNATQERLGSITDGMNIPGM